MGKCHQGTEQQIFLIDDDSAVRVAMSRLFESAGFQHRCFSSGNQFLDRFSEDLSGCLVLDVRMPGISGVELQRQLITLDSILPIIFMSGHGDLPMAVKAMRHGAVHFLRKPVDEAELLDSIEQSFEQEAALRKQKIAQQHSSDCLNLLTERERQIFERVTNGESNKLIASELNISLRTVEVHRSTAMKKLNARSLAQLVRLRIETESVD